MQQCLTAIPYRSTIFNPFVSLQYLTTFQWTDIYQEKDVFPRQRGEAERVYMA